MKKRLYFTVLPQDVSLAVSPRLPTMRLSVFVSPRLDPEAPSGTLGQFNLGNWPQFVAGSIFSFRFRTGPNPTIATGRLLNAGETALDPGLWSVLFPDTTPVRGFGFERLTNARIRSFPMRDLEEAIHSVYTPLAQNSPKDVGVGSRDPASAALLDAAGAIRRFTRRWASTAADPTDAQVLASLNLGDPTLQQYALAYYKCYRFYNRRLHTPEPAEVPMPPPVPDFDFHQMFTALGDYPVLLRRLGFVLDFEVGGDAAIGNMAYADENDAVRMELMADVNGNPIADMRFPWTHYTLNANAGSELFEATPRPGSDIAERQLTLSDPDKFTATQLDVDGAGLKVIDFAGNIQQLRTDDPTHAPQEAKPPSLRTGGVGISRVERAGWLMASFTDQDKIDAAFSADTQAALDNLPLYADDLLRGYRLDVYTNGTFRSLNARIGNYRLGAGTPNETPDVISDEGYIKAASVTTQDETPDELYAHESLFSWEGWSLSAPRPGRTIAFEKDEDDPRKQEVKVAHVPNTAQTGLALQVEFAPQPATLPPLRFGRPYRLRARTVDLAGNSIPLSTAYDQSYPSPEVFFRRYEPVQQPILAYRTRITEGESLEHMPIRSDRGASVAEYLAREDSQNRYYYATCERHVAPPKQTQVMCETHGALDATMTSEDQGTHLDSYLISLKEAGTFQDTRVFDVGSGQYVDLGEDEIELVSTASTPDDAVDQWPAKRGDSLQAGQYVLHKGEQVILPYLPDPVALGVTLEDRATGKTYQREWTGTWPDIEPFRLVVREGSEVDVEPRIEVDGDTLDVYLPKATIFKLRYSCYLRPDTYEHMAHWETIMGGTAEARERARMGTHWMLSPQREVTLVHCVQHPLQDPTANVQTDEGRAPGQTYARLIGTASFHGNSTSNVDISAHWIDPVDLVTQPGPENVVSHAQITSMTVAYGDDLHDFPGDARHEFGDTKHHRVVYQATGTTRFREYFPHDVWAIEDNVVSREQIYMPGTENDPEPQFVKASVDVLSTARPDMPKVLYMLPTFRWVDGDEEGTKLRIGRGVRVYLDRPWYSSGIGELLGVTFANDGAEEMTSQWGSDPLRKNLTPQNKLNADHLTNKVAEGSGLQTLEGNATVDVAGFSVRYNEQRRLWYADIDFSTGGAYFPLVRLSMCRFQPDSIDGKEISGVVRGEFIQLAPDRTASVTRPGSRVSLSLSGVTGDNTGGSDDAPEVDLGQIVSPQQPMIGSFDQLSSGRQKATHKAAHHVVLAQIERRSGDSDLDWGPIGNPIELQAWDGDSPDEVLWLGELSIPHNVDTDRGNHRIALSEFEVYPTDPDNESDDSETHPVAEHVASRLVYLAHFAVPAGERGLTT